MNYKITFSEITQTFSEIEFKISKRVINHHHRLRIDLKIAFSEITRSFSEVEFKLSKRVQNCPQRLKIDQ